MGEVEDFGPPRGASWGVCGWALVLGVFALGFATFPMRVVGWHFQYLPGDAIDNRLNNFVLEHGYRYLTGQQDSFWNAPAFYPATRVTATSDTHFGMLPIYSACRLAGLSPEHAVQGWFLAGFVCNYISCVWVLRRLGFGAAACACGGYLFTFGIAVAAQLVHAQLSPRFLVPPALLFAWEFLGRPRPSRLLGFLLCTVGEILIGVYSAYFMVLLFGMGLVVTVALFRSQLPWRELLLPGYRDWLLRVALVAAAVLAVLPLARQHSLVAGPVSIPTLREDAPHPESWFFAPPIARVSPLLIDHAHLPALEHRIFPGFVPLAAVVCGLFAAFRTRRFGDRASLAAVAAWSTALLVLTVTAFEDVWLYGPIVSLPGGGAVRAIGRIVLVLLFPMGVVIACGVDWLVGRAARWGKFPAVLASIAAVALLAFDQSLTDTDGPMEAHWRAARYSLPYAVGRQEAIKAAVAQHPHPTLVYVFSPPDASEAVFYIREVETMRACQDLGLPCANGYSGYFPLVWKRFRTEAEVLHWLDHAHAPPERIAGIVYVDRP